MSSVAFDTLRFSQRLEEAGLTAAQAAGSAAAFAEAIGEMVGQLASKHDLDLLRQEMRAEHATLRRELKSDMAQLELRMTIKLGTMMAGSVALTAALVKLL